MSRIQWSEDYATGINVIDGQHKRIVEYMNQLDEINNTHDRQGLHEVLVNLVDYTLSHFTFEEALMDESGYPGSSIHKRTHEAFRNRINDFQQRFHGGEDVGEDVIILLNNWLFDHIANDDNSYVPYVRENMPGLNENRHEGWLSQKIREIFG